MPKPIPATSDQVLRRMVKQPTRADTHANQEDFVTPSHVTKQIRHSTNTSPLKHQLTNSSHPDQEDLQEPDLQPTPAPTPATPTPTPIPQMTQCPLIPRPTARSTPQPNRRMTTIYIFRPSPINRVKAPGAFHPSPHYSMGKASFKPVQNNVQGSRT